MAVLEGFNVQAHYFFYVVFFGSNTPSRSQLSWNVWPSYLYSSLTLSFLYVTGRACQSQLTGEWGVGPKDDDGKILLFSSNRKAAVCCSVNTTRRKTKREERKGDQGDLSWHIWNCQRLWSQMVGVGYKCITKFVLLEGKCTVEGYEGRGGGGPGGCLIKVNKT